jgi:hypothetical protein
MKSRQREVNHISRVRRDFSILIIEPEVRGVSTHLSWLEWKSRIRFESSCFAAGPFARCVIVTASLVSRLLVLAAESNSFLIL